jgi:flagellar biogenesis protein FliO
MRYTAEPVSATTAYLIETFITLVCVCAFAILLLWGAKRVGLGRPSGPIELWGHLPLDGRRAIYLIKVADQVFVLGAGEGGFTKLGEIPASALPSPESARVMPFASVLARALRRKETP